jgi:uncharacterized repeat protein (TIGR02543 family)
MIKPTMKSTLALVAATIALTAGILTGCASPAPSAIPVSGITLSQTEATMALGDDLQISATVAPDNATNPGVTWESDAEAVATVSATGLVSAHTAGTAVITAKSADGGASATCTVTVANFYAVTFAKGDGTTFETQFVKEGNVAARPSVNPERAGYAFDGWYEDNACLTAWDFATKTITSGATVYSKWSITSYSINYVLNGGTQNAGNSSTFTVISADIALLDPSYTGFTFGGWYDNASLSGTAITAIPQGSYGDKTFYAKWSYETYTITYVSAHGTTNPSAPASYTVATDAIALAAPTANEGYSFNGWYDNASFTGSSVASIPKGSTGNRTFYAKHTAIGYGITYELNGGTQNAGNLSTYTVETASFTYLDPTKSGSVFAGWYDNASFTGNKVVSLPQGSVGERKLYAKWVTPHTVTFDANGGTGTMTAQSIGEGVTANLTAEAFSRDSFAFIGWATTSGATTAEYADGAAYAMGTANVTLYAVWKTIFTYTVTSGKAYITGFSSYWDGATDIIIPSAIDGYTVDSVSLGYKNTITSVTIPNSVTKLSSQAFYQCSALTTVTLGSGITEIPSNAFYYCTKLTSVTMGSGVTTIGSMAFYNCTLLASITLPSTVTSIGYNAFAYCSALTAPPLGSNLTSIGEKAFYYSGIEQATIPVSVTSIGKNVFVNCGKLTAINVAANNANYSSDGGVLFDKGKTKLIAYPSGKTGSYTVPSSVTEIGDGAFSWSKIEGLSLPSSVTVIGSAAFNYCGKLTALTIPSGVTEIKTYAFAGCGITTINIPASVSTIGASAFGSCSSLKNFTVDAGNASYSSDGTALFDKAQTKIITFPAGAALTGGAYALPSTVTTIVQKAFEYARIQTITIPEGLTTIEQDGFNGSSLSAITLPSTLTSIDKYAFWNNYYLMTITILATTPPTLKDSGLVTYTGRKVRVPASAVATYKAATYWSNLSYGMTIEAIE